MRVLIFFLITLLCGCDNYLEEYYYDYTTLPFDLPKSMIDTTTGKFIIEINRDIRFKNWKEIIEKAEACFPPKEEILKYDNENTFNDTIEEPLWWYKRKEGFKIPYALTGNSVKYYLNIINNSKNDKNFNEDILTVKFANLKYTANIKQYESFKYMNEKYENVYAVDMQLLFSCIYDFGEGMGFNLSRLVIFSEKEYKLLKVLGDHHTYVSTFHR